MQSRVRNEMSHHAGSVPLTELVLPGAQHAEHLGRLLERLARVRLGGLHAPPASSQRKNGLTRISSAILEGSVGLPRGAQRDRRCPGTRARLRLPGSTVKAKRRLAAVYSWPQNMRVSGGKFAQPVQRSIHLYRRTLEHSAAARAE